MQLANGIPFGLFGPPAVRPRTVGGAAGFSPGVPTPGNTPSNGFFGPPATYRTPGIGDGLNPPAPDAAVDERAPVSLMPLDAQLSSVGNLPQLAPLSGVKPQQPGFFAKDGAWRDVLGAIGDSLLAANGRPAMYMPIKLQRQQLAYQEQQRQRQRQDDWEDYQRQWDYQVRHPKPSTAAPYRWERNDGSVMELGPDGQVRPVYIDPDDKQNFIPDGMGGGRWVSVPRSSATPMAPANRPAIGDVIPDPRRGGGSGNATGGFR